MFGSIINRFQTFSPATSPVTSPKTSRRKYNKSTAHRRSLKDEYRDVQSEPEDACTTPTAVGYHRGGGGPPAFFERSRGNGRKLQQPLNKSKSAARLDISPPTAVVAAAMDYNDYHRGGSKSVGRLDGLKQVRREFPLTNA